MALPLTRNTSYVAGVTPVKAADLNDIQDAIVSGKHGLITKIYNPGRYRFLSASPTLVLIHSVGKANNVIGNGALAAAAEIDLPLGAVIAGFRLWVDPTVGNTVRGQLMASNGIAAATVIGTSNTSAALGADELLVGVVAVPYTVVTGFSIALYVDRVSGAGESDGLASFEIDYRIP